MKYTVLVSSNSSPTGVLRLIVTIVTVTIVPAAVYLFYSFFVVFKYFLCYLSCEGGGKETVVCAITVSSLKSNVCPVLSPRCFLVASFPECNAYLIIICV